MNIYDIAKKAGVSAATVSRVINNSKNVSEKNRKKIQKIIEQEGYVPNVFARGLNLNSIKTVGILCPVIDDINHAKAVAILERLLRKNGFDILLCCTGSNEASKDNYLKLFLNKRVDAIIVIGSTIKEQTDNDCFKTVSKHVPIIIINGLIRLSNVYCVLCDEESAIAELVCKLYEQGYKEILYITDSTTFSGYQKLEGYKKGLANCNIEQDPKLIIGVPDDGSEINTAYNALNKLINEKTKFTAVVASDDSVAIGALRALNEHNIKMPIIGFNNSEFAQCCTPLLTSIDNNMESLCGFAVDTLMKVFKGMDVASIMIMSAKLVERETFRL
jgi:LacI family transcriptional regulator